MDGCVGAINTFIVEPFVPHQKEYYLCIQSNRLGCDISFSEAGGIDIEANWDQVRHITVPTGQALTSDVLAPLIAGLALELKTRMEAFVAGCFQVGLHSATQLYMCTHTCAHGALHCGLPGDSMRPGKIRASKVH